MRFTSASILALGALTSSVSAQDAWTTVFVDEVVTEITTKTIWVSEQPASTSSASVVSVAEKINTLSAYAPLSSSSTYAAQPSTFLTSVKPASSSVSSSETSAYVAPASTSSVVTSAPVASSSPTVAPVASSTSAAPPAYSSSSPSSGGTTISVTPHDQYSSSIGVLGCKINTDRVAYWPMAPDCNNLCVKVSYQGRSLNLLRVDQSGGAHDISYDAWNTLYTGNGAAQDPQMGGGVDMTYEDVPMSECADLLHDSNGKLAFEAANSMNFIASCIAEPSSWVAQNYGLFNIANAVCTMGYDEECTLDLATSNQPTCPHQLGVQTPLTTCPVYNLAYGTGVSSIAQ